MTSDKKLLAFYGLKYNPFLPDIPVEDLWRPPGAEAFFSRVALLVRSGGFGLIYGDTGTGKSKLLHQLDNYLDSLGEVVVGVMERPQSTLSDFYREMGDLFGVNLSPANRYGGFKALRSRWRAHMKGTLWRPVLLVDEAQDAKNPCFNELRSLSSARFDSENLLTTVLCGDRRIAERFRHRDLLPLGSRIRARCLLDPLSQDDLADFLDHALERAGAPQLMTPELQQALCKHAAGNLRVLTNMGADLLATGVQKELAVLDDKLFFEVYSPSVKSRRKKAVRNNR